MKERILLEGMMPYRALNRLRREGISLEKVKKRKKNQIVFTVDAKDVEKIFAIYPNVCYNNGKYTPYTARILPSLGWKKVWLTVQKRLGLLVGGVLFLALTLLSDGLILRIEVQGEPAYTASVTEILQKNGVERYRRYPKKQADLLTAEILRLEGVSFCSIRKVGSTLIIEVHTSPFSEEE